MLIAQLKKETNIAEYILYMWQIEDIIRSYKFDLDLIDEQVVAKYPQPYEVKVKIKQWYGELIDIMQSEGIEKHGHLSYIIEDIKGLGILHQTLLTTIQDKEHKNNYEVAKIHIAELMQRGDGKYINEIDACLTGLYGLMLLRLKNKPVSDPTRVSMECISKFLAHLVAQYNKLKTGQLKLSEEQNN